MNIQTIAPADRIIERIIGQQRVEDIPYRISSLVIREENLLHNTLTGELIRVLDVNNEELIRRRYFVPIETNEVEFCRQLRDVVKLFVQTDVSDFVILPTTCCNARCFYCYESREEKYSMQEETVEKICSFIRTKAKGRIRIKWFGGEPLIGINQIDKICNNLKDVDFVSKMTSNGFLFTEEIIERAKKSWHLNEVQITLDGTEEIYNKTKNYYDTSCNPFKRVLENIQMLIESEIKVKLRMNVGEHNVEDLVSLINQVEVFKGKYFFPYVHTIFDEESEKMDIECEKLERVLIEKGMKGSSRRLCKLVANRCIADANSAYVITPKGDLSKCEHCISEKLIGNVDVGIDNTKLSGWKNYSVPPICMDCALLPSCVLLDECPNIKPCSPFEKANRIEKTKITMRELARKYDEEHK